MATPPPEAPAAAFTAPLRSDRGAMAVVIALCLLMLLAVLAFVLDTGFLFAEKTRYQNAVEAAAMAGAIHLCETPETAARQIAAANGIPYDEASLSVTQGFYDIYDRYEDFTVYSEFVARGDEEFPDEEYVNAVLVRLDTTQASLTGGLSTPSDVPVATAAVAYRQAYGLLAYGNESENLITCDDNWPENYLRLDRLGVVYSDGDIVCDVAPVVDEGVYATAAGIITDFPGGIEYWQQTIKLRPIEWEQLYVKATEEDRVIHLSDFPIYNAEIGQSDNYIEDENGNRYHAPNFNGEIYPFVLHDGDHNGAVYYFSSDGADESDSINLGVRVNENAYHFTVASELPLVYLKSGSALMGGAIGGTGWKVATIYSKGNIGTGNSNFCRIEHLGVVYRTEKDFTAPWTNSLSPSKEIEAIVNMRVVAGGSISLLGSRYGAQNTQKTGINGVFAPPCGPAAVRMGRL